MSELATRWRRRWPEALAAWGRFVSVHEPLWATTGAAAADAGLTDSFAMFRLDDRTVVLDLARITALGLTELPVEVMAHEIGHHVLCPGDLSDHARLLARVRAGLPELTGHAPLVANLYADLLINDRLCRTRGLRMDAVYAALRTDTQSPLWTMYTRIYEICWALPSGTLAAPDPRVEADAQLGARLVRVYAKDWLAGAGGFAVLCYRYLAEAADEALAAVRARGCTAHASDASGVAGLTGLDPDELGPTHPALDPRLNEFADTPADAPPPATGSGGGQYREPFEYGEILRQLGLPVDEAGAAVRYYRERAAPHLVRFPEREVPAVVDPLPEGTETWDVGEPLDAVDWIASTLRSPRVIPGISTLQRVYGVSPGGERTRQPVDLDLYVDSSGSMPDPRRTLSYLALAGAILARSALRVGARVQATLWAGAHEFTSTPGFTADEDAVLRVLTGYFGGGTAFPLHVLRRTYVEQTPARPTHVVVISDDGVDTMFRLNDELGRPGAEIAAAALATGGAGGSLILNLWSDRTRDRITELATGWDIYPVADWEQLVEFSAAFSRRRYGRHP